MHYFDLSSRRAQLNVSFLLTGLLTVKLVEASACSGIEEEEEGDEGENSCLGGLRICSGEMGPDWIISLLWMAGSESKSSPGMALT